MKQGINLTLGKKSVDNALRKVFFASVALFCLTILISFSLIVYRLILKNSFDDLDRKEQKLNQQILGMEEKRDKLVETKGRLDDIRKIIARRLPMSARITSLSQVIPEDVTVNNISGTDVNIQISLESDNLSTLNDLVEQKIVALAQDKKKKIKKIQMQSFGLNPKTLKYSITFAIVFG